MKSSKGKAAKGISTKLTPVHNTAHSRGPMAGPGPNHGMKGTRKLEHGGMSNKKGLISQKLGKKKGPLPALEQALRGKGGYSK